MRRKSTKPITVFGPGTIGTNRNRVKWTKAGWLVLSSLPPEPTECVMCGEVFLKPYRMTEVCSKPCLDALQKAIQQENYRQHRHGGTVRKKKVKS